ncbi:MAG TPA: S8 family serine peptidase, partial [Methanobacterium sp.]|nr:S8 family serine peptidase [Methanobacterium sp.]
VKIPENMSLSEALGIYRQNSNVIYAEPNYICNNLVYPNDPSIGLQWGLNRTNMPSAWNLTTGSSNVIIAVIDSGVDLDHPDLKGNLWINTGEIPNNGKDDDGNGYIDDYYGWNFDGDNNNVTDDNGHGTHVAGIIAASGNNTQGVTGVMWNATIMPLKFLDKNGNGYISDAVKAIDYATKMGAFIINCSWGGPSYSKALEDAIKASNALVVCAAGNEFTSEDIDASPNYPASYTASNIITVAAVDKYDNLCSFSNYGINSVDVAAPGASIYSTWPGARYFYMQGTSMATPYVSGLAGLIKSLHPELSALQVKYTILDNVDPVASLTGKILTGGVINAFNSLNNIITEDTVPIVNANLKGGFYYSPLMVNLTSDKPGTIYYTTNGTNPTKFSSIYNSTITLNTSQTLKFMAVDTSGTLSYVYSEKYLIYKLVNYSYQVLVPYKKTNKRYKSWYKVSYKYKGKIKYKWKYKWVYKWLYRSETRYGQRFELT